MIAQWLQTTVLLLLAMAAPAVIAAKGAVRQTVLISMFGLLLVLLFVVLQAPDVALSAAVVGSVAYPLIVMLAVARTKIEERRRR